MSLSALDMGPGDLVQPIGAVEVGYKLVLEVLEVDDSRLRSRGVRVPSGIAAVKVLHESGRVTMFLPSKLKIIQKAPASCKTFDTCGTITLY